MFKNVLILHKKSVYHLNYIERHGYLHGLPPIFKKELRRFKEAHEEHDKTIRTVKAVLAGRGVKYTEKFRGQKFDYKPFDLVITIGGDGTYLETAQSLNKNQVLVGVNSAPQFSIGSFCVANAANFDRLVKLMQAGQYKAAYLQRLRVKFNGKSRHVDALNDVLISHKNPAVLCRYYLKIGKVKEEQRSSGVWVATPSGSSAAIKSAGGKVLEPFSRKIEYLPRELFTAPKRKYRLKGGVLGPKGALSITSLMNSGMIYVDGANLQFSFPYGEDIRIALSPNPVKTIVFRK